MIDFNNDNRPICGPTTEAECKLNWAALQDVWDALKCVSTVNFPASCYVYENSINPDDAPDGYFDVTIEKDFSLTYDLTQCGVEVWVDGRVANSTGDVFTDSDVVPSWTLQNENEAEFTIRITLGELVGHDQHGHTHYSYRIKVTQYKTFLELFNDCEAEINCRDVE